MAILTALPTFRREGKPFLAFVYGIASHKVADAHRSAARTRSMPVAQVPDAASTERGPEQFVVASSAAAVVEELLGHLARDCNRRSCGCGWSPGSAPRRPPRPWG